MPPSRFSPDRQRLARTLGLLCVGLAAAAGADLAKQLEGTHDDVHIQQGVLKQLEIQGKNDEAFEQAFEIGDEMFSTVFNKADGVGANVGNGNLFTRTPRSDLNGAGQWGQHVPARATGPNAQSCAACHRGPHDGAGTVADMVHRDPGHTGVLAKFITRDTPPLFALGALQRLAEEMNVELLAIRELARSEALLRGTSTRSLTAKGIDFGKITARRSDAHRGEVSFDTSKVKGCDADLAPKPFQWKGNVAFVRDFARGAAHNEIGMQPIEIVGKNVDGDGDGVVNEFGVGDMTAMAIYLAAQPRPTTRVELAGLGLATLSADELADIRRGERVFTQIGCAVCHQPSLTIVSPIFSEPSRNPNYRDKLFPAGQNPVTEGVDPTLAIHFDLTKDSPENVIRDAQGNVVFNLGAIESQGGHGVVRLFGDLKRHEMGAKLAEPIDEAGTGASVFMTENLWGVGTTAPYLHDGRATTLTEAILLHGGEALEERNAFAGASKADQLALLAFLNNQVLFETP